jgi:hypothetical protein
MWEAGFNDDGCVQKPVYVGDESTQPNSLPCPGGSGTAKNLWVWSTAKTGCDTSTWLVHADPKLAAYAFAGDGYHLTGSSPSIDAGQASCPLAGGEDIDGHPRSGTCDAGPDEYGN